MGEGLPARPGCQRGRGRGAQVLDGSNAQARRCLPLGRRPCVQGCGPCLRTGGCAACGQNPAGKEVPRAPRTR